MCESHEVHALLAAQLYDPATSWSLGTFGAIAEFVRDPQEAAALRLDGTPLHAVTGRGGIRFDRLDHIEPVAYETAGRNPRRWTQVIALCLPRTQAETNRRTVLTELGADHDALREEDCGDILFDIGLGTLQVDVCIRTGQPELVAVLRAAGGRPLFEPGNPAMGAILAAGPHRVFQARLGRCEVYQPIPLADGRSPEGPHTHILPRLLRTGRSHAATAPIPDGLVPCAHLYLADTDGWCDRRRHLFRRFGDPDLVALKDRVETAVRAGRLPDAFELPEGRFARAVVRVTLRQLRMAGPRPAVLPQWLAHFDGAERRQEDDEELFEQG